MKSETIPFDIHIPATEDRAAIKVATIDIEIYRDEQGNEMVTPESTELIEKTQARYMGLLTGEDIKALRKELGCSQERLSELLGCGKKSLSRWENGHGFPTQLVNTTLRLLEDERITLEDLRAVRQPRHQVDSIIHFVQARQKVVKRPTTYNLQKEWKKAPPELPEPLAQ